MTDQASQIRDFGAADVRRMQRLLKEKFGLWAWLSDPLVEGMGDPPAQGPGALRGQPHPPGRASMRP